MSASAISALKRQIEELEFRVRLAEAMAGIEGEKPNAKLPVYVEAALNGLECLLKGERQSSVSVPQRASAPVIAPAPSPKEGPKASPKASPRPEGPDPDDNTANDPSPVLARLREEARRLNIAAAFRRVPADYYDRKLEERQVLLNAPTKHYLCKSMIMCNTKCSNSDWKDPKNSKYYVVIYQYTRRFNNEKLVKFVQGLSGLSKSKFNFRLAPEEVSEELSGYGHNSVTPLGMKTPLPIVLSHRILELGKDNPAERFFWLGAGEPDLKLKVFIDDFLRAFADRPVFIADVTYGDDEQGGEDATADE